MSGSGDRIEDVSLQIKAYHEAGHAIVAHFYQRTVFEVSISKQEGESCVVPAVPTPLESLIAGRERVQVDELWQKRVEDTLVDCCIGLGGPMAEAVYLKTSIRNLHGSDDFDKIVQFLIQLDQYQKSVPILADVDTSYKRNTLSQLASRINYVFTECQGWGYVQKMVGALLVKQTLLENDIKLLLDGMTIDGNQQPSKTAPDNYQYQLNI